MNRWMVPVVAVGCACAFGSVRSMGQGADAAGGLAALEAQKAQLQAEMKAADVKRAEIVKALEAKPVLSEAKKLWDSAETAYQEFVKGNADYAKLSKARGDAEAAARKAIEDGKVANPEYVALRKQGEELRQKRGAIGKDAALDKAAVEKQKADLDAEMKTVESKKTEIRKTIEAQPANVELMNAAAAAAKAFDEFTKTNADFVRLLKARDDAANAYRKVLEDAKDADPDYTALRKQRDELKQKMSDIERQLAAARPK